VVDRASVRQFEEGMGFIHLLQVCLQESSCHNAPEHDESGFGKAIADAGSVRGDSENSRMVGDLGIPSSQADPYDDKRLLRKFQHILDRRRAAYPVDHHRKPSPSKSAESFSRSWMDFRRVHRRSVLNKYRSYT